MRYTLTLSYDGSKFSGWQIQNSAPSVQESLQKNLSLLLGNNIAVTGAGRTDAKVNAINYIAHFDSPVELDAGQICYKLNAILPSGITVHKIDSCAEDFHSRFAAKSREYMYFINRKRDPFCERYSYKFTYPLNMEAMNEAASHLLGTKDFSCFQKIGSDNKTSICTIFEASWSSFTPEHVRLMGYPAGEGDYIVFKIRADRFLRNMVRAVVGTLLEIGRGRKEVEWIDKVIASKDRCAAGDSVPGHSLFLTKVEY